MGNYNNLDELYHYGVPGMKWGVRRRKPNVADIVSRGRRTGPVMGELRKKTERQKRFEDSRGINPHRPNGTRNGKPISEMNLGKLDNYRAVNHGKKLVEKLLDPNLGRK